MNPEQPEPPEKIKEQSLPPTEKQLNKLKDLKSGETTERRRDNAQDGPIQSIPLGVATPYRFSVKDHHSALPQRREWSSGSTSAMILSG